MKILNLLFVFFLSACSLVGVQNEESPKYKIIKKEGAFEIREYSSYLVAKTTVRGVFSEAQSEGFKILAGYIFGNNKAKKNISMTSPVAVSEKSEKIKMTAPVMIKSDKARASLESQEWTVVFSMPSNYTIDSLPVPDDSRVQFEEVSSKLFASYQFSGSRSLSINLENTTKLKSWLQKKAEYLLVGNPIYAGYNPPWTLPFLKRNEVLIELELAQ